MQNTTTPSVIPSEKSLVDLEISTNYQYIQIKIIVNIP